MNTCKDCAKWSPWNEGAMPLRGDCKRVKGADTLVWADATCPAWEKRRDKLDERATELWEMVKGYRVLPDFRALLEKWAAEDKEAR